MAISDLLSIVILLASLPFFLGGTVGIIRFPDVYCRLHALTKADNLGLGLVVIALMLQAETWQLAAKLLLIWLLVMVSGASVAHLIARTALREGEKPWQPRR